ncbi:MAG TPA: YdiU family protein [Rhizomicrobium sp.]|jgi:uncharacterized protein YdiU (UPF0061 family)|nr:YdiU family protein [Rhizomicrobium sp.]
MNAPFTFQNTYARLPERFYARLPPTPVAAPQLVKLNVALAKQLGLDPDALASQESVEVLAGNRLPEGSEPLAMAYAGHQFGNWVPQLGDGRAVLLGEIRDAQGINWDIQLKGAGRTPFSRGGDGRAALGPVMREYIISEAMHGLGIPTTRSLAMVTTGEVIERNGFLPGAVLTRVARSHVRVGTFEYFGNRGDAEAVRTLADYVISRLYPDVASDQQPYRALLDAVIARQANLIAQWLGVGFIHGVMNTDNTAISGETIDYGPCAFMDTFHPAMVYSSIDQMGRYAYGNQPGIVQWNLAQFAQALIPIMSDDQEAALKSAQEAIDAFPALFKAAYLATLRKKIGLAVEQENDGKLAQDLLKRMADSGVDFTLAFRRLSACTLQPSSADDAVRDLFHDKASIDEWLGLWRTRLADETRGDAERQTAMRQTNPAYIARNHRVEQVIAAAQEHGDFGPLETLLQALSEPFVERPGFKAYMEPPKPDEVVRQTFCGT